MQYKYCYNLSGHLMFNNRDITNCTIGNNANEMKIPKFFSDYNGEPVNWNKIFKESMLIRENCKKGIYPKSCIGCTSFVEKEWDDILPQTKELQYCQFSNWIRCNSECIYCDNHVAPNQIKETDLYDSLPILKNLIELGYITKNTEIDFAGGEPTLYYRLTDMLSILINTGVKKISIHTNAIKYNKIIEEGIKRGIISICVSIDAGSKKIHRVVKRVNSYDKVWKNINKYSKMNNPIFKNYIALKYIIIPNINDTEEEIELFIQKSIKTKVDYLILNADNNVYKEIPNAEIINKIIELAEFFKRRCEENNVKYELAFNIKTAYAQGSSKRF